MLKKLKNQFNKQTHTTLHPSVVGINALEIPVFEGMLLYGHDNITFEGNILVEEGAVVQRGTSIIASAGKKINIGSHAPIMDYVEILATKHDIFIGKRVTIAHGSKLISEKGKIEFLDDSFGNIIIRVDGGIVEERGYIGPNTNLTSGEVIPAGAVFFGNPKFQASIRTDLDGKIVDGAQHIMRMNIKDTSQSLLDSDGKPLTIRNYNSYEGWISALINLYEKEQSYQIDLPFEQWLRPYSLKQVSKAAEYMRNEAEVVGQLVWHSPTMQSDILFLAKVRDTLVASSNPLAFDVENLIKAHSFILGIYEPTQSETEILSEAYLKNSPVILSKANKALKNLTSPIEISCYDRETAYSVVSGIPLKNSTKRNYQLSTEELHCIANQIENIQDHITRISNFHSTNQEESDRKIITFSIMEIKEMATLRSIVNKTGTNMFDIPDGVTVRTCDGAIPFIHPDAMLVGKVDISGAVRIDSGSTIINSSIRTEQRIVPAIIEEGAIARNVIFHTASREQHPVVLGKRAVADGSKSNMICLHGSYVADESYIAEESVVPDEVRLKGIVLPKTVVDPSAVRDAENWAVYGGNLSAKGLISRDIANGQQLLPEPLRSINLMNEEEAKYAIQNVGLKIKNEAETLFAKKIEKYGDIYKYSAQMQIDLLSLRTTISILESQNTDEININSLRHIQEGYEYLLGSKSEISIQAGRLFYSPIKELIIKKAQRDLSSIVSLNPEGISVPAWPNPEMQSRGEIGYDEVYKMAERSIHPSFREKQNGVSEAIEERLHREFFHPPEEIINLIKNLDKICPNSQQISLGNIQSIRRAKL